MRNIILSKKDANLLETAIMKFGRIVSFEQLQKVFKKEYSNAEIKNRLSLLAKTGWLFRFKRGLYAIITDLASLKTNDISVYTICKALNKNSYISFENALQFHGMFDQMLSWVSAVTFNRARKYVIKETQIKFFKIKKSLYFGFSQEISDIGTINMATKEKAILDILYFSSDIYHYSLVWEKLSAYKHRFDFDLLKKYTSKFNLDIIRKVGFFLDCLGIDTKDLHKYISGKTSYSRMTQKSRKFDAKWRLYFDNSIIK